MVPVTARIGAAFRFLTILPLPAGRGDDRETLAAATPFFPLVGLVLGGLAAGCGWLLLCLFPPLVRAVLLVLLLAGFSGFFHLDGLADTADGFLSARPRDRILEIMHDSRIGVMGVVSLILVLALKISALAGLGPGDQVRAVFLMPLAGRTAILLLMAFLPYARPEGGLGQLFYTGSSRLIGAAALVFFLLIVLPASGGFFRTLLVLALFLAVLLSFALACQRIIGGATGDTLGAGCELGETSVALALALISGRGW